MKPLRCDACGGGVPLVNAPTTHCPYCDHEVPIPEAYRELLSEKADEARTRKKAARTFRRLARAPGWWADAAAIALALLLPAAVSGAVVLLARAPMSIVVVFAAVVVPALLPGAAVGVWSLAVHATVTRFRLAMAGHPAEREGGPPRCRRCGAPLHVDPDAAAAHCPYCGTDNLVDDPEAIAKRVESELGEELSTLEQANHMLRVRRWTLVAGTAGAAIVLGGLASAAALASLAMGG